MNMGYKSLSLGMCHLIQELPFRCIAAMLHNVTLYKILIHYTMLRQMSDATMIIHKPQGKDTNEHSLWFMSMCVFIRFFLSL